MKERYPLKGGYTSLRQMDRSGESYPVPEGIVLEMIHYDPSNVQLPTDPDEVQCRPGEMKY